MNSKSSKHFYWLDWFRFAAAFEVMTAHVRGYNWTDYYSLPESNQTRLVSLFYLATHLSQEAVILFFVLSGFLVGGKVLERVINRSFDASAYAIDRITRIYVPLVPTIILSLIIGCWICGQPFSFLTLLGNVVGLQSFYFLPIGGNWPLWTLAYEILFYVLAGLIGVLLTNNNKVKVFCLFGIMFVFALFTGLQASFLFCWCLGALGYMLFAAKSVNRPLFISGLLLAIFGVGFYQYISLHGNLFGSFLASGHPAELIFSAGIAVMLPYFATLAPKASKIIALENLGSRLASFSYTLYLTHYLVLRLWYKFGPERHPLFDLNSFAWYFLECLSCFLFAFCLYVPFEAQTGRVRKWASQCLQKSKSPLTAGAA
jgi:peptidoglycan/LPS O-acetylase OafA/YrhL